MTTARFIKFLIISIFEAIAFIIESTSSFFVFFLYRACHEKWELIICVEFINKIEYDIVLDDQLWSL